MNPKEQAFLDKIDYRLYTQEDLDSIVERAQKKIRIARLKLINESPFLGSIISRLGLKSIYTNLKTKTAATDGLTIFYNPIFIDLITDEQTKFVLAHEVLHPMFDHLKRRDGRDPLDWNKATDFVINGILDKERIGIPVNQFKICLDRKYDGMTSEEIYKKIRENGEGANSNLLDDHLEDIASDIIEKSRENMSDVLTQIGKEFIPNSVKKELNILEEGEVDWKSYLRETITSLLDTDYSFMKQSRKSYADVILPGIVNNKTISIAIAIDISGSISDDQREKFLTELMEIFDTYTNFRIHLWNFDTKVKDYKHYDEFNISDIAKHNMPDGGGTDFMTNWEFMKENQIEPEQFLLFTDGQPIGEWGDENYCETIFMIEGNPSIIAPFGATINVKV